jgi:hypothetical protein
MFERLLSNRMLTLSLASLLVAVVVVIIQLPGVASAILVPSISDDRTPELLQTSLKTHEEDTALYRKRFVGRSIFFMPEAPRQIVASLPRNQDVGPPPDPPPPPPPEKLVDYGGPEILALLGDQVHIAGGKVLKLGQEDADTGLTVLDFVPPWSVQVRWHKKPGNYEPGIYVVEMFKSDDEVVFSGGSSGELTPEGLSQANEPEVVPASGGRRSASPQRTED